MIGLDMQLYQDLLNTMYACPSNSPRYGPDNKFHSWANLLDVQLQIIKVQGNRDYSDGDNDDEEEDDLHDEIFGKMLHENWENTTWRENAARIWQIWRENATQWKNATQWENATQKRTVPST